MHEPVLLQEVLTYLSPKMRDSYLDVTAGYGGHAAAVLETTQNYASSVLVDRDQMAIDQLRDLFSGKDVKILQSDFFAASKQLTEEGQQFDMILADLGVSSPHLNIASRGFSFSSSGPLDMRMDQSQELTAEKIVNEWPEEQLEQVIKEYGEEPRAKRITRSIVDARPLKTTEELANVITRVTGRWQKKHPATRTFQALRIAVNNELAQIESVMPIWLGLLKPGGRLGVISFHSLEDRIVKEFFAEHGGNTYDSTLKLLNKKPITASKNELVSNPRSRSAKLRVAVKIKTKERASDEN